MNVENDWCATSSVYISTFFQATTTGDEIVSLCTANEERMGTESRVQSPEPHIPTWHVQNVHPARTYPSTIR